VTNYCNNRLLIKGSTAEIGAFVRDCLSSRDELHVLDFERIRPVPPVVKGLYRSTPSQLGGTFPNTLASGYVGMEALLRKVPPRYDGEVGQPTSILEVDFVQRLGIKNYDDLNRWLERNDPPSLELGRRCLAAFEACGYFFADDWMIDEWGCYPERVDYSRAVLTDTSYEASFVTPDCAPEGILREIARRHSSLTSQFIGLEEGNGYAFTLTTKDNVIREEWPPITDALIDELEGPGEVQRRIDNERALYERPSVLRKRPMRKISYWLREWRLKRALSDYPVYAPPRLGAECMMPEAEARENFDFFLSQRLHRIDVLKRFLAHFKVSLDAADGGRHGLDRWLAAYGALLFVAETGYSFLTHRPDWTGVRAGLNVIFDIGIYLGEAAIAESPKLKWDMDLQGEAGRTREDHSFQRPCISAAADLYSFPRDIIDDTYRMCYSLCEGSYLGKPKYVFGRSALSRQFATKTLRHIRLCAQGDFETANRESIEDSRKR